MVKRTLPWLLGCLGVHYERHRPLQGSLRLTFAVIDLSFLSPPIE
jgi:hypothetical protein